MKKAKILIVEDEEIVKMVLREYLANAGYAVMAEASTGEDAIALVEKKPPD